MVEEQEKRPAASGGTRDRLALAAVELFQTQGYGSTTIDDIATRAGVGRRTFFRYFRSKEDAVFPDHERLLEVVRTRMQSAPGETAFDAVTQGVRLVLASYVETREISLQRYRLVGEVPTLREREIVSTAAYQRLFRERLELEGGRGDMDSLWAEIVAASVAAAHNFVLRQWLRQGGTTDPVVALDRALTLVRSVAYPVAAVHTERADRSRAGTALVVMGFDESTGNEEILAEIERARAKMRGVARETGDRGSISRLDRRSPPHRAH